ncbi:hypothetical protein C8R47DRAFT_1078580 [Mycena vitilis]|nr:hypothetical protein C8R47DRAFT_1078580 [Mycena vitilis]
MAASFCVFPSAIPSIVLKLAPHHPQNAEDANTSGYDGVDDDSGDQQLEVDWIRIGVRDFKFRLYFCLQLDEIRYVQSCPVSPSLHTIATIWSSASGFSASHQNSQSTSSMPASVDGRGSLPRSIALAPRGQCASLGPSAAGSSMRSQPFLWHKPMPPAPNCRILASRERGTSHGRRYSTRPRPRGVLSRYLLRALTISVVLPMLGHICCMPSLPGPPSWILDSVYIAYTPP